MNLLNIDPNSSRKKPGLHVCVYNTIVVLFRIAAKGWIGTVCVRVWNLVTLGAQELESSSKKQKWRQTDGQQRNVT